MNSWVGNISFTNAICTSSGIFQSGFKEIITKEYHCERLGELHMNFASFNGNVKLVPNVTFTAPEDGGDPPFIRVTIQTTRPKEESTPVEISEGLTISGTNSGIQNLWVIAKCPEGFQGFGTYGAELTVEISSTYVTENCHQDKLTLKTSNGNIEISDPGLPTLHSIFGYSSNGNIQIFAACSNVLTLTTSNGTVRASITSSPMPTRTWLKTSNGNVVAAIPDSANQVKFSLNTSNGVVVTDVPHTILSKKKKVSLHGIYNSSTPKDVAEYAIDLKTSNGNVKLLLKQ